MIRLLRFHQYLKNLFIFLPAFFALKITNPANLLSCLLAFCFFSILASGVYIFNDWKDLNADRMHPVKKFRPLASGKVSLKAAMFLMVCCLLTGSIGLYLLSPAEFFIGFIYVVLNTAYSLHLKHIAILDVAIIAVGFVLRLYIGAAAADVTLSKWIIGMTFLLALFLALAKRRDDVLIYMETGKKIRRVIDGYNLEFVNASMMVMAATVIVSYALYTVSPAVVSRVGTDQLYLTTFFVVIGILKYIQITIVQGRSGSPTEILLKERFIQGTILGWLLSLGFLLYSHDKVF